MPTKFDAKRAWERLGWMVGLVERYVGKARRSFDLFGFADYVAIVPGRPGVTFVQSTSADNGAARVRKLTEDRYEEVWKCLHAGNFVEVWAWKRPTKRRPQWDARIYQVKSEFENLVAPISDYTFLKLLEEKKEREEEEERARGLRLLI